MVGMHYDFEGNPIDLHTWGLLFESSARIVEQTDLPNGYWVSTVWMGLDHSWNNKKLIYETMVFWKATFDAQEEARYSTLEDAVEGHKKLVEEWSLKRTPQEKSETLTPHGAESNPGGECDTVVRDSHGDHSDSSPGEGS